MKYSSIASSRFAEICLNGFFCISLKSSLSLNESGYSLNSIKSQLKIVGLDLNRFLYKTKHI